MAEYSVMLSSEDKRVIMLALWNIAEQGIDIPANVYRTTYERLAGKGLPRQAEVPDIANA